MDFNHILIWILVGGVAGILADAMVKGAKGGLFGRIIIGILGAVIGGWLLDFLKLRLNGGLLADIVVAFIGAVILLLIISGINKVIKGLLL